MKFSNEALTAAVVVVAAVVTEVFQSSRGMLLAEEFAPLGDM